MKRLLASLAILTTTASVSAEDQKQPAITFGGFVDLGAVFNPNRPANHENFLPGTGTTAKRGNGAFATRVERFRDPDNGISGFSQTLREGTVTYEYRPVTNLILKFEGRHDHSTASVFTKRSGSTNNQTLALLGAVVTF